MLFCSKSAHAASSVVFRRTAAIVSYEPRTPLPYAPRDSSVSRPYARSASSRFPLPVNSQPMFFVAGSRSASSPGTSCSAAEKCVHASAYGRICRYADNWRTSAEAAGVFWSVLSRIRTVSAVRSAISRAIRLMVRAPSGLIPFTDASSAAEAVNTCAMFSNPASRSARTRRPSLSRFSSSTGTVRRISSASAVCSDFAAPAIASRSLSGRSRTWRSFACRDLCSCISFLASCAENDLAM